jgi:putative membrane protein
MNPTLTVLLLSWSWRPEIILTLSLGAAIHLAGRRHLQQRGGGEIVATWRSVSYLGGLAVVWIALMSPIDVLAGQFFYMHMIQHLLLVMIAPPLLLVANPLPIMMWGLPSPLRREVGHALKPGATVRRILRAVTGPGPAWLMFVFALVGWHDSGAYDAALRSELVHDAEHLSFFITAMLFWWHVTGAAPHIHKRLSRGMRTVYVLSVIPPNMIIGLTLSFATEPVYSYYTTVPRPGGMSLLQDQMLGGVLMWIPGSMMYIIAALVLIAQILRQAETATAETATDESV